LDILDSYQYIGTTSASVGVVSKPCVLVFSAADPSSGAGMQADVMTISNLNCHPVSVLTALTSQDTTGVSNIYPIAPAIIEDQSNCILKDVTVQAIKIGLIGSLAAVEVIVQIVKRLRSDFPLLPVILDPVLASGRGDEFADVALINAIINDLFPLVSILTPNSIESLKLVRSKFGMIISQQYQCAEHLVSFGCEYVLITGTHLNTTDVDNVLYSKNGEISRSTFTRLDYCYHGSGCTLASAISSFIARGYSYIDAVTYAQQFTYQTLLNGFRIGPGQLIPDRCFNNNHH
jgi:hydroxymethylpyrimidine/phosphomethylpyrimidine kinase